MAGGIFHPVEVNFDDPAEIQQHPLVCYLCHEQYENPCVLHCYHSFCAGCLRGRAVEGQMSCPLCGTSTAVVEESGLPASDALLQFFLERSCQDKAQCANCDQESRDMFYCNTCEEPLCGPCRQETHRARMFAKHEIVQLTGRTKDIHKRCSTHNEPYIMFSLEKNTMLCINCFRDIHVDGRTQCVDMDTAYSQGCRNLDQAILAIRELQMSVQDSVCLLRSLLGELKQNADQERAAILSLCTAVQQSIEEAKKELLSSVDRQHEEKEKCLRDHLTNLNTQLPTLYVHLVISTTFRSSANKYEFLHLAHTLMERLNKIAHKSQDLQPSISGHVQSDCKAHIARCVEPLLFARTSQELPNCQTRSGTKDAISNYSLLSVADRNCRLELTSSPVVTNVSNTGTLATLTFSTNGGRTSLNQAGNKIVLVEAYSAFADHCKEFDNKHRDLVQQFDTVKQQVQDLHRDLTQRRCLARKSKVSEILNQSSKVQGLIVEHLEAMDTQRALLEQHWEDTYQRVTHEQQVYQAQLCEVTRMKKESEHLGVIAKQLVPFIRSITELTQRISPRLGDSCRTSQHEDQLHALFEHISTIEPDSQHRVDAIQAVEEDRQTQSANKVNPLDDELIKTKGMLRAPSARRDSSTRQRGDTSKAKEIPDAGVIKEVKEISPTKEDNSSISPGVNDVDKSLAGDMSPCDNDVKHSEDKTKQSKAVTVSKKTETPGGRNEGLSLREQLLHDITSRGENSSCKDQHEKEKVV